MISARSVVLYSRPGCHLCDECRAILRRLAHEYRFQISEVDITADQDAFLRYWLAIPVVVVGESTVAAALDEARLRSVLDWEFRNDATAGE